MKKILLTLLVAFITIYGYSQSLSLLNETGTIENNSTLIFSADNTSDEILSEIFVKNISGEDVYVKLKKIENYKIENSMNVMCWGMCYGPATYVSSDSIVIPAGATNETDFSGHYSANGNAGLSSITYVLFNVDNPSDSVSFSVNYVAYEQRNISLTDADGNLFDNTVVTKMGSPNEEILSDIFVKNNSGNPMSVKLQKIENFKVESSMNVMCWGMCYGPTTYISSDSILIDGGAVNENDFSGHYTSSNTGISSITYKFFDIDNPGDFANFTVLYNVSGVGINNYQENINISNVYPNPVINNAYFDYDFTKVNNSQNNVVISNLLGEVIENVKINDLKGKFIYNTSNLKNGIYFFSIVSENRLVNTKKIIVNH